MLFLPAAALCCLCSALVAMAAELIQDQLSLTRRVGETVSFSCGGTDQCKNLYVFWYQKKETETFNVILLINRNTGTVNSGYNHPQKDDFVAFNERNGCELKIKNVQLSHSASYYCSCYEYLIFGSGTKLYVTDEPVVKPVVSVYPAASRAHLEGKSSLLCLASAMSPPLVQFSWKRQKEDGSLEELTRDDGEQLVLTEPGRTAAILLIHQPENSPYKYRCYVKHEGGTVEAQTQQDVSTTNFSFNPLVIVVRAPAPPPPPASVQHWFRERLLCLLYTGLIVKSLVYCCGLSVIRIFRNKGPFTHSRRAD
ncbi:immunoglobulin lambda-1 light chain-like [Seriola dumerili]|uniref:immunoglobulin lambda-1 light chain-like n=1 Tax=Seriola dumerili TaxID=41447 RepID=UPI000BBE0995|nr:immunoglobulin lambda-1 light chain-like [Seriola dumerili]